MQQEQNRSEAASPFKLQRARERGAVPKSADLNAVFVIAALLVCLQTWAWPAATRQAALLSVLLGQSSAFGQAPSQVWRWLTTAVSESLLALAPLFAATMLAGVLANLVQHGPVFSAHPLKPDVKRLDPVAGFKRIFSKRALFDLGKNLVKLALLGWMLHASIVDMLPSAAGLLSADPRSYGPRLVDDVTAVVFRLLLVLLAVALVDLLFVRWEYAQTMRMSRRELRDELKQREGDPAIKARIRELRNALRRKSQALRNLPGADVLVVNPTHLGVALTYRHGEMAAPAVVAKGAGELVEKMKAVARRHGVPIVEHRRLAQALYAVDLHGAVPEAHYAEVARILVWVQVARRGRGAAAGGQA